MKASHAPVLRVKDLHKSIQRHMIVDKLSFDIHSGEIFGFLGPNGAGKTTTIRMLVDLIKPTGGTVEICGHNVQRNPERALKHVGCIVENPEVYNYMSGWQNLEQFARMMDGVDEERIREVTEIVKLEDRIHDKVKTYSLGMRQRLGIAQALLGKPKLLILDEPTNGLDPKGMKELRAFVHSLADEGISLLISSHMLSEVQMLCGRVAIMDRGKIIAIGKIEDLMKEAAGYVNWRFQEMDKGVAELCRDPRIILRNGPARDILPTDTIVVAMPEAIIADTIARLSSRGIGILAVCQAEPTLEELFLTLTGSEVHA
ncbi:ABC transporter ATP-binding protein [Paenibacillus paeoniae]|uniref:ABC transporter ATP-binding protein n=1 Tax=Paenibacillus paeoniae TaxID=2292705 RepID=A0A371PLV6_9BACL|nr:ABC transporter ATP-binding protein [Paenibacillus paeoniae]REK77186.1 ABC transporter ATP-binding protein [Paenibacillus paeoniae]